MKKINQRKTGYWIASGKYFQSIKHLLLWIFGLGSITATAQVKIILDKIPNETPQNTSIYVAGDFNNWNPQDIRFKMIPQSDGTFVLEMNVSQAQIEFKFTQGNWDTTEGTAEGGKMQNRLYQVKNGDILRLQILNWEKKMIKHSTASPQVRVIAENFQIPQLKRTRRIWLYLPKDYAQSGEKYPVLYMQDGQNLFDAATSYAGEWGVDEFLDQWNNGKVIVVGIDNGGTKRMREYSPWKHPRFGGGDGDKYMKFIVKTLKPFIDANYRTLSDSENTGIMGSSMGGLISFYGAMKYPDVFGKAGVFSPSFWISQDVYHLAEHFKAKKKPKIYFLAGGKESPVMVQDTEKMFNLLKQKGFTDVDIKLIIKPEGNHSEGFWQQELPQAFEFLFGK
jgi:predicted alpha/beta superfamily hydrolase